MECINDTWFHVIDSGELATGWTVIRKIPLPSECYPLIYDKRIMIRNDEENENE